jgi:dTDP-D-glucose 4,6-dehydratase
LRKFLVTGGAGFIGCNFVLIPAFEQLQVEVGQRGAIQ